MSIPLDRLYHYLEGLTSDDIIIYRWYPHGSKKLSDLDQLITYEFKASASVEDYTTKINMICHDQEPLDYNYYSVDEFRNVVDEMVNLKKNSNLSVPWCHNEQFLDVMAQSHFRVITHPFLSLHDNLLLCHSEQNSEQLKIYEQNGFVGVYYWSHAVIARDWFRYAEFDSALDVNFDSIKHDFLIYNRAWSGTREYRLKMIELLQQHSLLAHCNIRFNAWDNNVHYLDHKFKNDQLSISTRDFETVIPENTVSSDASADYVNTDYAQAGIEVVLETLFDDTRHHLTEKSLRPIACGRPFILATTPGSLNYLRQYGFKTFDRYIDESYDLIEDPLLRLQAIVTEMKRISGLDSHSKKVLWEKLYQIAAYNKARFFSQEFHNHIVNEYVNNVNQGIQICKQTMTGKWWRAADSIGVSPATDFYNTINDLLKARADVYDNDFSITPSQLSSGSCST